MEEVRITTEADLIRFYERLYGRELDYGEMKYVAEEAAGLAHLHVIVYYDERGRFVRKEIVPIYI